MEKVITIKKGQELELLIERLAYGGMGVARQDGFVVFVKGAIPGQKVLARIVRKKKSYAEARVIELLEQSTDAVTPRCLHFGACGGCQLQNFDYGKQAEAKGEQVKELLERLGGMSNFAMLPTLPSRDIYYYRNKMEFSFSRKRWLSQAEIESGVKFQQKNLYLGFHARGFFDKVIDLEECHIVNPVAAEILKLIRDFAEQSGLPAYSTQDHKGFWRFLIVRPSGATDDIMVNFITSRFEEQVAKALSDRIVAKFPQVTSVINGVTASKASVAFCEEEHVMYGKPFIMDKLGDYVFRISPNSFFQTNTRQAAVLYDVVKEFAQFKGDENVYDLYCGAGTIAIYVSGEVKHVVGFESVASAIKDAGENCALNGVTNCSFVQVDLKDGLTETERIVRDYGRPDVLVLDPPRGGMHPKTIDAVLSLDPPRIVHVSCNPTTLARELSRFCESNYKLVKVQPVDMFPHTAHVEAVALLVRK